MEAGVPPGSVSSGVLFHIFINDLLKLKFHGNIYAFADGDALNYSYNSVRMLGAMINNELNLLRNWCL